MKVKEDVALIAGDQSVKRSLPIKYIMDRGIKNEENKDMNNAEIRENLIVMGCFIEKFVNIDDHGTKIIEKSDQVILGALEYALKAIDILKKDIEGYEIKN